VDKRCLQARWGEAADVSGQARVRTERPISLNLINHLLQSYGYYAVFAFIALESLGILPGETTLIAAAAYAGSTGHFNIEAVFLVAATAAILGDNDGYWLGRTGGQRLANRYGRFVRLDATKLKIGRYLSLGTAAGCDLLVSISAASFCAGSRSTGSFRSSGWLVLTVDRLFGASGAADGSVSGISQLPIRRRSKAETMPAQSH
jgi:membrane protein YqaA with SNARE-associated domain